jgi:hypothetical protein
VPVMDTFWVHIPVDCLLKLLHLSMPLCMKHIRVAEWLFMKFDIGGGLTKICPFKFWSESGNSDRHFMWRLTCIPCFRVKVGNPQDIHKGEIMVNSPVLLCCAYIFQLICFLKLELNTWIIPHFNLAKN